MVHGTQLIGLAAQREQQVIAGAEQQHVGGAHGRPEQHSIDAAGAGVHTQPGIAAGPGPEANRVAAFAAAEHVVARATIQDVEASSAQQLVVVVAADQLVVAVSAAQQVVAGAALQGVGPCRAVHHIVAIGDLAQAAAQLLGVQHRAIGELEAVDRHGSGGEPAAEQQAVGRVGDLQHQVVALASDTQRRRADAGAETHTLAAARPSGIDDGVDTVADIELKAVVA